MLTQLSSALSTAKFKLIAESPTLAIGAGVIGLGATIFLSSRATLKSQEVLAEYKENLAEAHENHELIKDEKNEKGEPKITEKDYQLVQFNILLKTSGKILKLYGPSIALAGLSIASIVYGRNAFQNRLTSLSAAYQVVSSSLEAYRKRVAAEVGEEKEDELYFDMIKDAAPKEDKEHAVIKKSRQDNSVYARFFDESSPNWTTRRGENRIFLTQAQAMFNDILSRRGFLFLNEVYEHLGIETTPEGQYIGWVKSSDPKKHNYVDFGLFNSDNASARRFVNDDEVSALLDFNVSGYILDKM